VSADNGTMAADIEIAQMRTLNDDPGSVKLRLPPSALHGLPEPLRVTIDFEADMVDEMLALLTLLQRQILPAPAYFGASEEQ
jgi:hypothetical protein